MFVSFGLSVCQGVKCPIYSYIFLYLEDSPIYSYIFLYLEDSPIYIPIFQGKQEILNSYLKQFYPAVAKYMIRRLPLDNVVLKAVTCLSSVRRFDESSVSDVEVLARSSAPL